MDKICVTCSDKCGLGMWLSEAEAVIHSGANPDHQIVDEGGQ